MRDMDSADNGARRTTLRGSVVVLGLTIGALLGALVTLRVAPPEGARFEARIAWPHPAPGEADWPRAPRAGETARLLEGGSGHTLVVTAGDAATARTLVREFAARHAPDEGYLERRYGQVLAKWRRSLPAGPRPAITNEADLAAWLLARANWGRLLAAELPVPASNMAAPIQEPDGVLEDWEEIISLIEAGQTIALLPAFERAYDAEQGWFRDPTAWAGYTVPARAEAWRQWQLQRAGELEEQAAAVLFDEYPSQQRLARAVAEEHLVELGSRLPAPWTPFAMPNGGALRPLVRPILAAWWPPLAVGAGAGALLAVLALFLSTLMHPAPRTPRHIPGFVATSPSEPGPDLHLVCGTNRTAVTRAALELAAHPLAAGERVLLVDGSAKLALHERLRRDARWGLLECLAADMPVLGLVQYAGHPGLYLLPHGNAERSVGWSPLGRKMDEVVPHFGRIVLILDPRSSESVGDALRGRAMEGWWASADGRTGRAMEDATARFGIVFQELDLSPLSEATLEALVERVRALRPIGPVPEPAPITARALPPRAEPVRSVLEPIVLDCDLQVRQRLRFLAWTRRVQAENRRATLQPTS